MWWKQEHSAMSTMYFCDATTRTPNKESFLYFLPRKRRRRNEKTIIKSNSSDICIYNVICITNTKDKCSRKRGL